MMPYGDIDLGQHWLRWWLGVWWHQAITWTNVDYPVAFIWGVISQEASQPLVTKISFKITYQKFNSDLPGANELI